MNLSDALNEIRTFWTEPTFPFIGGGERRLAALERDYGQVFPPELRTYVGSIIAADSFSFTAIGNPIDVYGYSGLSKRLVGYNYNPITREVLHEWSDAWFLIGDEGADPIIVDLTVTALASPVLQAMHGEGEWDFDVIASSLGQFVVLAAARHHAMNMLPVDQCIIDDESGFNLARPAAEWLFPRVRKWAPDHYTSWLGAFDNA